MKKIAAFFLLVTIFQSATSQTGKIFFTSKENTRAFVDKPYNYQINAEDSAGRSIAYSIEKLPSWLRYNKVTKNISGKTKRAGQYLVQIIAHAGSDSARQVFMLTVCNGQTTNILCLGNSLTNGVDTFNSYRRDMWQMLHAGNYNFDFIGSWSKHHMGTNVPVADFDMDHEGHSGWTFEEILKAPLWDSTRGNLHEWIKTYTPGIVLIELGTNDVFHCRTSNEMFANLNVIVYLLREKNKHVKIFLAQIPPLGPRWSDKKLCRNDTAYATAIINFNKNIVLYAGKNSSAQSPVIVVDQFTGIKPATDMFDDIHPNTTGEKIMAERWFKAIRPFLKRL